MKILVAEILKKSFRKEVIDMENKEEGNKEELNSLKAAFCAFDKGIISEKDFRRILASASTDVLTRFLRAYNHDYDSQFSRLGTLIVLELGRKKDEKADEALVFAASGDEFTYSPIKSNALGILGGRMKTWRPNELARAATEGGYDVADIALQILGKEKVEKLVKSDPELAVVAFEHDRVMFDKTLNAVFESLEEHELAFLIMEHPNHKVRGWAIHYSKGRMGKDIGEALLHAATQDENRIVRSRAFDELKKHMPGWDLQKLISAAMMGNFDVTELVLFILEKEKAREVILGR